MNVGRARGEGSFYSGCYQAPRDFGVHRAQFAVSKAELGKFSYDSSVRSRRTPLSIREVMLPWNPMMLKIETNPLELLQATALVFLRLVSR